MARGQRVVVKFTQDSLGALCAALVAHAERLNKACRKAEEASQAVMAQCRAST